MRSPSEFTFPLMSHPGGGVDTAQPLGQAPVFPLPAGTAVLAMGAAVAGSRGGIDSVVCVCSTCCAKSVAVAITSSVDTGAVGTEVVASTRGAKVPRGVTPRLAVLPTAAARQNTAHICLRARRSPLYVPCHSHRFGPTYPCLIPLDLDVCPLASARFARDQTS